MSATSSKAASSKAPAVPTKRRQDEADDAATSKKKGQRENERKKKDLRREAAVRVWNKQWTDKAATISAWRKDLLDSGDPLEEQLVKTLNVVREADQRPTLVETQRQLLANVPLVHEMLLDIFKSPMFWSPSPYESILEKSTVSAAEELAKLAPAKEQDDKPSNADAVSQDEETIMDSGFVDAEMDDEDGEDQPVSDQVEDELDDTAQFYIRRLSFSNHSALSKLLDKIRESHPQYAGHIDVLVESSATEQGGERWLSYGGYTIATSVVGRQKNDQDASAMGSFLKAVLSKYKGSVELFEVRPLRFKVGNGGHHSVMYGRNDARTRFYEGLVIDCWGFMCLNTAPPGIAVELSPTADFVAGEIAVKEAIYTPKQLSEVFSWLKVKDEKTPGGKSSSKKNA